MFVCYPAGAFGGEAEYGGVGGLACVGAGEVKVELGVVYVLGGVSYLKTCIEVVVLFPAASSATTLIVFHRFKICPVFHM